MLYTEVTDSDVRSADASTCRSAKVLESADFNFLVENFILNNY